MSASPSSPSHPRVLAGRYTLSGRIGAGGMGTILRATDGQMDREVAIKVLHRHLASDVDLRARFKAEAKHAASLSHPNIVAVYDQGDVDLPYIVMELVDGPSLREVLASHGPMSPAQMLAVLVPLCRALTVAHQRGLVHRDVKPENVLVTPAGIPKLADFGIARVMATTRQTATGILVGSVHYLAPELVDGSEATPASDQYALGVLAFELLTARKPLPAETPMAIALRHANEDIPPPSRYAQGVPSELDRAIAVATAKNPAQRYPSVQHFAAALTAAVDAGPDAVTTTAMDGSVQTLILPPSGRDVGQTPPSATVHWVRTAGAVAAVITSLALLAVGGYLYWDRVVAAGTPVPQLVGISRTQAQEQLQELGLVLEIDSDRPRLVEPVGQVIGQRPETGSEVAAGSVVEVVLSGGPTVVQMPVLTGRMYNDVILELQSDFFDVADPTLAYDDAIPAGQVITQDPASGAAVPQGGRVTVTVSRGVAQVEVPNFVGGPVDDAKTQAQQAGLGAVVVQKVYSDEVEQAGTVISQSLTAGAEVDKGRRLALTVSIGPTTVEVPSVAGMTSAQAKAGLEQAGLVAVPVTQPAPMLGPYELTQSDVVVGSVPAAGDTVPRGQPVELYYFTPR